VPEPNGGTSSCPLGMGPSMAPIYVTGHRNPDADSIAAAVGYAELKRRLDPDNDYVAVRLGELNPQTQWILERSGTDAPEFLPHVMLRVCDVMRDGFPVASEDEPVRRVGRLMAREGVDLVVVVDGEGALAGVLTERALARRYIRESREASRLDAPTTVAAICETLEGEIVMGAEGCVAGRVWVLAMDAASLPGSIEPGDIAVAGDRPDAQTRAIEAGVALLVTTNGTLPADDVMELSREHRTAVVRTDLDSYVASRMITLSAPCRAFVDGDPLTTHPGDLVSDHAEEIKDVSYRAAVALDSARRPIGLVTRSDLVNPRPRRVLLVDHAEQAQSVPGIEEAEIVEILDHHHIGSIETRLPVMATFDPVGSTATLVVERFRQNGMEPSAPTATLLLGAVLSDTVILNSPTTTERDVAASSYLGRVLAEDPVAFGREMFESTSDVTHIPAEDLIRRDAKVYEIGDGQRICIAQVETVGTAALDRKDELLRVMRSRQEQEGYVALVLMLTDILARASYLLIAGDARPVERAFGRSAADGVLELEGVMSRKKQVAPVLMGITSE
jgi:manganese-dependent inorganic pyrophosphatase